MIQDQDDQSDRQSKVKFLSTIGWAFHSKWNDGDICQFVGQRQNVEQRFDHEQYEWTAHWLRTMSKEHRYESIFSNIIKRISSDKSLKATVERFFTIWMLDRLFLPTVTNVQYLIGWFSIYLSHSFDLIDAVDQNNKILLPTNLIMNELNVHSKKKDKQVFFLVFAEYLCHRTTRKVIFSSHLLLLSLEDGKFMVAKILKFL